MLTVLATRRFPFGSKGKKTVLVQADASKATEIAHQQREPSAGQDSPLQSQFLPSVGQRIWCLPDVSVATVLVALVVSFDAAFSATLDVAADHHQVLLLLLETSRVEALGLGASSAWEWMKQGLEQSLKAAEDEVAVVSSRRRPWFLRRT